MVWQKFRQKFSLKHVLLFLFIVAFIVTLLHIFRYPTALSTAPGFEAIWVTQPRFPTGYVKTGQIILEYRPCTYELLGWQGDSLYYQSDCRENMRFWHYDVGQNERAEEVTAVPPDLTQSIIPHNDALQMVRADGVRPRDKEAVTRGLLLAGDGLASADGEWTAVISQHIYAPQDILLITENP